MIRFNSYRAKEDLTLVLEVVKNTIRISVELSMTQVASREEKKASLLVRNGRPITKDFPVLMNTTNREKCLVSGEKIEMSTLTKALNRAVRNTGSIGSLSISTPTEPITKETNSRSS